MEIGVILLLSADYLSSEVSIFVKICEIDRKKCLKITLLQISTKNHQLHKKQHQNLVQEKDTQVSEKKTQTTAEY